MGQLIGRSGVGKGNIGVQAQMLIANVFFSLKRISAETLKLILNDTKPVSQQPCRPMAAIIHYDRKIFKLQPASVVECCGSRACIESSFVFLLSLGLPMTCLPACIAATNSFFHMPKIWLISPEVKRKLFHSKCTVSRCEYKILR